MEEEPDVTKQDIRQITEVQQQAILWKCEKTPRTMRPGTEKGYYVYIEDEGGMYLETIDEKGVLMLVLDTETDGQLPTDCIMEQDTDKYFTPPMNNKMGMIQRPSAACPPQIMTGKRLRSVLQL